MDSAANRFIRANAVPTVGGNHWLNRGLVEAAGVLDRLGEVDSAVVLYEAALNLPILDLWEYEISWYPFVLRRLGELHESLGHREQATAYYSQFVDLWKDADPELQPQVESARAALARLLTEHG